MDKNWLKTRSDGNINKYVLFLKSIFVQSQQNSK